MQENCGRPRNELSEEKNDWIKSYHFLSWSDMTYINPGRQDNVYIGKVNGERKLFAPAVLAVDLEGFTGYNQW